MVDAQSSRGERSALLRPLPSERLKERAKRRRFVEVGRGPRACSRQLPADRRAEKGPGRRRQKGSATKPAGRGNRYRGGGGSSSDRQGGPVSSKSHAAADSSAFASPSTMAAAAAAAGSNRPAGLDVL